MKNRREALIMITGATAAVAAGSIVAAGGVDPIYAAIEKHRRANEAFSDALNAQSILERELPKNRRRTCLASGEYSDADDPHWIASEHAVDGAGDAERAAAWEILEVRPTTLAGAAAVLNYAADFGKGEEWPSDGIGDSWEFHFHKMIAGAIEEVAGT